MKDNYHQAAFPEHATQGLNIRPEGIYVDATLGGATHSKLILKKLISGKLFGFDQDEDTKANIPCDEHFQFIHGNFRYMSNFLAYYDIHQVDGIIADLGISSHHIDTEERGFYYRRNSLLDMRMNQRSDYKAVDFLNDGSEEKLTEVFQKYGELHDAARIAEKIVVKRQSKTIQTTFQLKEAIKDCIPKCNEYKFLSKVFQAIRIEVNDEIEALKELLLQSVCLVRKCGRLVVISYHSGEDRLVKNFMKSGNFEGTINKDFYGKNLSPFFLVCRGAIIPEKEEIAENSRVRSARLRIAERN